MDVDEHAAQGFELGHGSRRVVDEGAALARGGDFAAQDALVAVEFQVVAAEEFLHAVGAEVEEGLNDALGRPVFDGFAVGALSEEQADGAKDDGLSRAGFSGDDGKSGLEADVQRVDEGVVLDE